VIHSRGVSASAGAEAGAWPRHTSQHGALAAALRTGRALLVPNAVVHQVLIATDSAKARALSVIDAETMTSYELRARFIVLAASTLESTRILLSSRSRRHPSGLGSSSGLLGRFLMDHPCTSIFGAIDALPSLSSPPPLMGPEGILVPRFGSRGFGIFGGVQRRAFNSEVFARGESKIVLTAYGEMVPRRENRVVLDPEVVDRFGIPALHVSCAWSDDERALVKNMEETLLEMLDAVGARVS